MFTDTVLEFPRRVKQLILVCLDLFLIPFCLWISFSLRLGELYMPQGNIGFLFAAAPLVAIPVFIRMGLYRAIIRYIGFYAMWSVVKAVALYTMIWGVAVLLSGIAGVPRSVLLINCLVTLLLIGGSRALARWWVTGNLRLNPENPGRKKVAIYGAGSAGIQIATALTGSPDYRPVAFIDDNRSLQNNFIHGLRVYRFSKLGSVIEDLGISEVILAMPSVSRSQRSQIITRLEPYAVHVTTLPSMDDLASGKVKVEDLREVGVRDLLGRDTVEPDLQLLCANVKDRVVMVTGAGGSIGSELCRQIIRIGPRALILYERSEHSLFLIENELSSMAKQLHPEVFSDRQLITPILASILNQERLEAVCQAFSVETIYHAAAYKHVPMVERNPSEAVRNNVLGTYRAALAAINSGVETFVLISTDKAVRPTSTMGATKRFAEMILQGLARRGGCKTRFTMVRRWQRAGRYGWRRHRRRRCFANKFIRAVRLR